ncbi:MAG: beta strand repeat-containing protein, partial [Limisphaerales bacterium]
ASGDNGNFIANTNFSVNVLGGGAVIDSDGIDLPIAAPLLNGVGGGADGGLTKLGAGDLTLSGANTYNGTTSIGGGALNLTTTNFAGGEIIVSNTATLHTTVAAAGSTMNCSALTLGENPGDNLTEEFDANGFGNPSVAVVHATNLVVNGTVTINLFSSSNLLPGTIPLIQYDNASGGGTFVLNFAQGVSGYITNDTSSHSINFVAVILPDVIWRAAVDTNWDTTTYNWVSAVNGSTILFQNGAGVIFDDSASNSLVNLTDTMLPLSMTVSNNALNYTFTGPGKISGSTGLLKLGSGTVTMALTNVNDYTGDTIISNGVFQLGADEQIPDGSGNGDVVLEGKLDLAGFNETINGLNGNNGVIDNSGTNPVTLTVGNNGDGGTFAGQITNSGASLTLNKVAGNLTLLANNNYSGGTINGGDELTLASEQSIGGGPLTLDGGTLDWMDTSAHTLTNALVIGGDVTFGSATNANGPLTMNSAVDLNGGNRALTCNEDVMLAGGATNGSIGTKDGASTLTLKNSTETVPGTLTVHQGIWVMDNDTIIEDGGNIRLQCTVDNGLAGIVVTNGASLILSNTASGNLRVGATDVSGGASCTNFLDVAGLVQVIPTGSADALLMGGSKSAADAEDDVNLLPGGVLEVHQIKNTGTSPTVTALNFNGGTLRVASDDFADTFLEGLTTANVLDGGAVIDTAGYDITIGQDLLTGGSGTGGLTKQGLGTLYLSGNNTYTGATIVSAGGLGGTGIIISPVTVQSGANLSAGASSTSIGTLTINNTVTFDGGSSAVMKITKISGVTSSDSVSGMTTINYGGTLVVTTNIDMTDTFAIGDTFTLFNATTYNGSFATYDLPPLPAGLGWDTSHLNSDGSIRVIAQTTPPSFNSVTLNGSNLVMSGSGGTADGTYYVLGSTNIALPLTSWTPIATNQFDGSGNFSFTNVVNAASPAQFFDISVP